MARLRVCATPRLGTSLAESSNVEDPQHLRHTLSYRSILRISVFHIASGAHISSVSSFFEPLASFRSVASSFRPKGEERNMAFRDSNQFGVLANTPSPATGSPPQVQLVGAGDNEAQEVVIEVSSTLTLILCGPLMGYGSC